jgi:hypothetical protein
MIAALAACSLIALAGCNKQAGTSGNADQNASAAGTAAAGGTGALAGTWKADLSSIQMDSKPDTFLLKDGKFTCSTCTPTLEVPADGALHPVTGRPYADALSVKVVDDHTVQRTSQKGGKETGSSTMKVSPDGKTLTVSWKDSSTPNTAPVTGEFTETRVAPAPAGAHAVSGSWKTNHVSDVSDEALTETYTIDGDTVTMKSAGQSYTAKLGGPEVPMQGDIGGTTVNVTKVGDNGIRETFHRDGKVVSESTSTLGADGKLTISIEDKRNGSTTKYVATKS